MVLALVSSAATDGSKVPVNAAFHDANPSKHSQEACQTHAEQRLRLFLIRGRDSGIERVQKDKLLCCCGAGNLTETDLCLLSNLQPAESPLGQDSVRARHGGPPTVIGFLMLRKPMPRPAQILAPWIAARFLCRPCEKNSLHWNADSYWVH